MTVLTGRNGAGKSTTLQVIAGLTVPSSRPGHRGRGRRRRAGARRHGGVSCPGCRNARCWSRGLSRDNLVLLGELDDLDSACAAAGFDAVLAELPDGLDTVLGRGGVGLSLGQRQRLGLARALGLTGAVLLLDEPTAHLDARTEDRVLQAIAARARAGATVVVVGHRERVVAIGDRVVEVVAGGEGVMRGLIRGGRARLLRPRVARILAAIALGALSLASALALAGVSAWLITRACQMPPVLDLSVAVVAVRTFAISRGVLRYCERLATHDAALRAAGTAREQIYHRLAGGPAAGAVRLHSGELVARVGADVDTLADVLVRALVPIGVAAVLSLAAIVAVGLISLPAAVVLAVCLVIAGVVAPWLAGRGRRRAGSGCPPASFRTRHFGDARPRARARTSGCRCTARDHRRIATPATGLGRGFRRRRQAGSGRRGDTDRRHRNQRARRGGGRDRACADRGADDTGRPDVVAAVRI